MSFGGLPAALIVVGDAMMFGMLRCPVSGVYTVGRELGNRKYRVPPSPKSNERIQAARRVAVAA